MAAWPYSTKRWQQLRRQILIRDMFMCQMPSCRALLQEGRKHPQSAVVDHRTPHNGDDALAFDPDNLWALCKSCHDSEKRQQDRLGYSTAVGEDGFPLDPRHPFNRQG